MLYKIKNDRIFYTIDHGLREVALNFTYKTASEIFLRTLMLLMNKSKKYCIVSFIDSFEFPLREATRKELWWEAEAQKAKGYEVEILIVNGKGLNFKKDGINIKFVTSSEIRHINTDVVHCLTGSVSQGLPLFLFTKASKKILTLTDGYMLGTNKYFFRRTIAFICPFIFNECQVYSNFQRKILRNEFFKVVKPHLPVVKQLSIKRTEYPSVLYMGHLSKEKGFDFIIPAMRRLLSENKDIRFVIANNMIQGDTQYIEAVVQMSKDYRNQVEIKGVVDPIEELCKTWVYIYPFIEARGTMAYALSLYEAQQCCTPFVACRVSANSEFFDENYLIEPNNSEQLYNKVKAFIDERRNS